MSFQMTPDTIQFFVQMVSIPAEVSYTLVTLVDDVLKSPFLTRFF